MTLAADGFVEHQRINRRATLVVLGGTFVLVALVTNALAAALGGYTQSECRRVSGVSTPAGQVCETSFMFRPSVLLGTIGAVAVYLAIAYLLSGRAALALSHARPVGPDEKPELRSLVEQMAIAGGIPMPKVYIVDDPAPNAFATGRNPAHAAVTVTTGLLATLSHRELRGVIAHEVAHIKNRDIAVTTLSVLAVGLIALLAQVAIRIGAIVGRSRNAGVVGLALMAVGALMFLLAVPAGMLLKAALSRKREALADATAVELTREPMGLRSALEKLEADTTVLARPSPAVAHLWIESPLQRGAKTGLAGTIGRMFDTHPPLADRIALLRGYEGLPADGRGPNDPAPGLMDRGVVGGPTVAFAATIPASASMAHAAEAGWHPDPHGTGRLRWWDGGRWTDWVYDAGRVTEVPL